MTLTRLLPTLALFFAFATGAQAYVGPGAGIGVIGTAIGVLLAVVLLAIGFIWYPLRRFLRNRRAKQDEASTRTSSE